MFQHAKEEFHESPDTDKVEGDDAIAKFGYAMKVLEKTGKMDHGADWASKHAVEYGIKQRTELEKNKPLLIDIWENKMTAEDRSNYLGWMSEFYQSARKNDPTLSARQWLKQKLAPDSWMKITDYSYNEVKLLVALGALRTEEEAAQQVEKHVMKALDMLGYAAWFLTPEIAAVAKIATTAKTAKIAQAGVEASKMVAGKGATRMSGIREAVGKGIVNKKAAEKLEKLDVNQVREEEHNKALKVDGQDTNHSVEDDDAQDLAA